MGRISRRTALIGGATALGAVALPYRASSANQRLRVGVIPNYTPFMPAVFAANNGYFADLPVEIISVRSGSAGAEVLAAGGVDIVTGPPQVVALAHKKDMDSKLFAASGASSPQGYYLAVPAASSIRDPKELDGATVAISGRGSTQDVLIQWTARNAGINVEAVPLGTGGLHAMYNGQVKAAIIFPLSSFSAILSKDVNVLQDYSQALPNAAQDFWVANAPTIAERKEELKGFLSRTGKALKDLKDNEELTVKQLSEYHSENNLEVLKMAFEKMILPMKLDSSFNLEGVETSLQLAQSAGMGEMPKASDIVDMSLFS